jgi:hypothetical protein
MKIAKMTTRRLITAAVKRSLLDSSLHPDQLASMAKIGNIGINKVSPQYSCSCRNGKTAKGKISAAKRQIISHRNKTLAMDLA